MRSVFIEQSATMQKGFSDTSGWVILSPIEARIKEKIEAVGVPLKNWDIKIYRGILTGYNEAFIIDEDTKNKLINASPKNAEIIRPILRGRDIFKYGFHFANKWMIIVAYGAYKTLAVDYPAIYSYLLTHKDRLQARGQCRYSSSGRVNVTGDYPGQHHWLELDNNPTPEYLSFFEKPKIIWGEISDKSKFAYDEHGFFTEATTFLMTGAPSLKYLIALMNSLLLEWYFNQIGTATGVGTNRWKKYTIEMLPIKTPSNEEQEKIVALVDKISNLNISSPDHAKIVEEIDASVFKLYGLDISEIAHFTSSTLAADKK